MKFQITLKDPDGVYESIEDAAKEAVAAVAGVDEDEREGLIESKRKKLAELFGKWCEYGEYLTVEVDTDEKTCVVVPRK